MSWQSYVDNMMQTKHMTSVGIFGLDGSTWASTPQFPIDMAGIKSIITAVGDASKATGLMVNGEKFIFVRSDPSVMIVYKKEQRGVVAYKSNQSIIVAIHDASCKTETSLTSIGKVADYLVLHGY